MLDIKKLNQKKIILASKSPRRHLLLKELGLNFEVKTKEIEENYPNTLYREEIPLYLSKLKAKAFEKNLNNNAIIITADTIVWMGNYEMNKPSNKEEAINMLQRISAKKHEVITAVCIKSLYQEKIFYTVTDVYFKKLTKKEIFFYLEKFKPYDKAGGYGIQEWIGFIGIDKINGSFHNVMGLPTTQLYKELHHFI